MRFNGISPTKYLKTSIFAIAMAAGLAAAVSLIHAEGSQGEQPTTKPRYGENKQLLFPEGYRSWVFVGASIGLSYSEGTGNDGPGAFHHVYLQPEAYAYFKRTGQFPEKTMLVMEVHKPEQKVSINKQGYFEGDRAGLEVALKDHEKFEEGWAYFDFANGRKQAASAFPKASCWSCHNQHGADDNVFTQFYPVLREAKKARQALNEPDPVSPRPGILGWDRQGLTSVTAWPGFRLSVF
jgi:cytochrome P460